jgi:hypothetical protein
VTGALAGRGGRAFAPARCRFPGRRAGRSLRSLGGPGAGLLGLGIAVLRGLVARHQPGRHPELDQRVERRLRQALSNTTPMPLPLSSRRAMVAWVRKCCWPVGVGTEKVHGDRRRRAGIGAGRRQGAGGTGAGQQHALLAEVANVHSQERPWAGCTSADNEMGCLVKRRRFKDAVSFCGCPRH